MTTARTGNFLIGRRMAEIRKRRRFTQEQLAARLGRGKRQYQNYEGGVSIIPAGLIIEIADILGCEAGEFLKSPGSPIKGWQARVTKPGKPQPRAVER